MSSNIPDLDHAKKGKSQERSRCQVCGRRRINHLSHHHRPSADWEAEELEQLVETMQPGEVANLLGISRWELEKRCQSLSIHWRGSEEEEE